MLRAVIYDLDGTLIDSTQDLVDSVNALLLELSLRPLPKETIAAFIGEGAGRLVSRSLAAASKGLESRTLELMPRWFALYGDRLLATTRLYDGIATLLQEPPPLRAVLTNKPGVLARKILQGLGVASAVQEVIGGDEAERKPSPKGLLALCKKLGVPPEDALLVGDTTIDVATGRAAGVPVCAVSWGLHAERELRAARPDFTCASPRELSSLLRELATKGIRET